MNKTSILILLGIAFIFAACKKEQKLYYYETYETGVRYSLNQNIRDTTAFIDSAFINYDTFRGDTINYPPDSLFLRAGSYYIKRYQNFDVYRYSK